MRSVILLSIASLILTQAGYGQNSETSRKPKDVSNPKTSPADINAGKQTFHSHCSPCHGYNAEGGIGPNLAAGHFYHGSSDADLYRNISEGIPGTEMPGLFYNGDRIWQIVAYIRSLHVPDKRPAGDPRKGAAVYASAGCGGCHRVNGSGGSLGPDLSDVGAFRSVSYLRESIVSPDASVARKYWVASLEDPTGAKVRGLVLNEDTYSIQIVDMKMQLHSYDKSSIRNLQIEKKSPMPSYRGRLSDSELQDLVAYLWTLRPTGTLISEAAR